jgi:glycosyltransferase involved in cell wall biosynthesis
MYCPEIEDLPEPLREKTGWPWRNQTPGKPGQITDERPWPRITIVTPSYNQGQFLEETIRSVLLQGYPDLEYIIIDGASTDNSTETIKKYEPWLKYWVSEPDRGQSHAINKGFQHASGEILAWLNSDDIYLFGALWTIGNAFKRCQDKDSKWNGWLTGVCIYENLVTQETKRLIPSQPPDDRLLLFSWRCPQRSSFWTRACWEEVGGVSEDLHFVFDTEFFLRLVFSGYNPQILSEVITVGRLHDNCKTLSHPEAWGPEVLKMYDRLANFLEPNDRRRVQRAVRTDLARVHYEQARSQGRWFAAAAAASQILWHSPPWNRSEGLPI